MKNRIQIFGLFLLLCTCLANVKSQESNLVVKLKNGTSNSLSIKSIKSITITTSIMNLNFLEGNNSVYTTSEIQKMYFENVTAIPSVNDTRNVFTYPNPTTGLIYFKGLTDESVSIQLFNINGMQVFAGKVNASVESVDLGFLPRGIYIINLNNQIEKLIKL